MAAGLEGSRLSRLRTEVTAARSALDGATRKKIFSTKHRIKGKYVDVKLAEADKKKMDLLNANKKVFVGGLEQNVDASRF